MAADGKTDHPLQGSSCGDSTTKNNHEFEKCTSSSHTYSSLGDSSSSCDTADDASSFGSFSISSNSNGSLYDLSDIMAQLPIKRGLSQFYQGKSESFTSLSSVASMEDLAKKTAAPCRKKLKAFKRHGNGLDRYKPYSNYVKKLAK